MCTPREVNRGLKEDRRGTAVGRYSFKKKKKNPNKAGMSLTKDCDGDLGRV